MSNEIDQLACEIVQEIAALRLLNVPNLRLLRRDWSRRLVEASPKEIVELALRLTERSQFQFRFVAYELVLHHKPALRSLDAELLERLGGGMDSWGDVDMFGCYLAGPAWREGQVPDSLILGWARSPNRWWRRAALVSTVPLNNRARGGSGDASRTLEVCNRLIRDRDDMVVKAMSWALRALAQRNPSAVRRFVKEKQEHLAPRVVKEVNSKLRTGLKNPKSSSSALSR